MKTVEILKKARALLSDPARWTKDELAKDRYGFYIRDAEELLQHIADGEEIKCYCMLGALIAAEGSERLSMHSKIFEQACQLREFAAFNDAPERTHADVLQRFDEAIVRLEQAEAVPA